MAFDAQSHARAAYVRAREHLIGCSATGALALGAAAGGRRDGRANGRRGRPAAGRRAVGRDGRGRRALRTTLRWPARTLRAGLAALAAGWIATARPADGVRWLAHGAGAPRFAAPGSSLSAFSACARRSLPGSGVDGELLAGQPLDVAQIAALVGGAEGDRDARRRRRARCGRCGGHIARARRAGRN